MIEKVIDAVRRNTGREGLTAEANIDSLDIDSLEFVVLMQEIESEFWEIPQERWSEISTVGDIACELERARQ